MIYITSFKTTHTTIPYLDFSFHLTGRNVHTLAVCGDLFWPLPPIFSYTRSPTQPVRWNYFTFSSSSCIRNSLHPERVTTLFARPEPKYLLLLVHQGKIACSHLISTGQCTTLNQATSNDGINYFIFCMMSVAVAWSHIIVTARPLPNKTGNQIRRYCSEATAAASRRRKLRCFGGTFLSFLGEIVLRKGYELPTLFRNEIDSCCRSSGRGRRDEGTRSLDGKESSKRKCCATRHYQMMCGKLGSVNDVWSIFGRYLKMAGLMLDVGTKRRTKCAERQGCSLL